jgi:hypothetical protein
MIAFTNHALDHLLSGVLDAGITKKIVRLGSRSADERISQYSIENLEMATDKSRLKKAFGTNYYELKQIQQELVSLVKSFAERQILSPDIMSYIEIQYPEHHEHICNPPEWISTLISLWSKNSDEDGGWETAGKRGSKVPPDDTVYGRWLRGEDLDFLNTKPDLPAVKPAADGTSNIASEVGNRFNALSIDASVDDASDDSDSGAEDEESDQELEMESDSEGEADWQRLEFNGVEEELAKPASAQRESHSPEIEYMTPVESMTPDEAETRITDPQDLLTFFNVHSMSSIPEIPVTDRELETLLAQGSMWTLSKNERWKLDQYWRERTREDIWQGQLEEFENLRRKYKAHQELTNQGKDEVSCLCIERAIIQA